MNKLIIILVLFLILPSASSVKHENLGAQEQQIGDEEKIEDAVAETISRVDEDIEKGSEESVKGDVNGESKKQAAEKFTTKKIEPVLVEEIFGQRQDEGKLKEEEEKIVKVKKEEEKSEEVQQKEVEKTKSKTGKRSVFDEVFRQNKEKEKKEEEKKKEAAAEEKKKKEKEKLEVEFNEEEKDLLQKSIAETDKIKKEILEKEVKGKKVRPLSDS